MKSAVAAVCALVLIVSPLASASATKDRTITQVVKALEGMMEASKADGNEERKLFAKYKCYCDTNEAEKKDSIASLTDQISILESEIEATQGSTGGLSEEVAQLSADMDANKQSQEQATSVRNKEEAAYIALSTDLMQAMGQMTAALRTLSQVGADQTMATGADNAKFMAGYGAAMVQKTHKAVRQALIAASAFVDKKQTKTVEAFLQVQAPFTGSYTAQSGEVVGILKDMRDTFKANLDSASKAEREAIKAYDSLMTTLTKAYNEMFDAHAEKQGKLGGNDETLATKKSQLKTAESTKADDEAFLEELIEMCDAKAAEYKNRVMMRTNEEAAIAEAISILNSDAAFATFGGVSATNEGAPRGRMIEPIGRMIGFVQIRQHVQAVPAGAAHKQAMNVAAFLAPTVKSSPKMARVIAMLQTQENPFATVLEEIKKMLAIIDKEAKADQEQFNWCKDERKENSDEKTRQTGIKDGLIAAISELNADIDDPATGLKASIANLEASLAENDNSQKTETKQRTEDNLAYQKDIANLVEAQKIMTKAIKVLDAYYSQIEGAFLQNGSKDAQPAPPKTWKGEGGSYQGRSAEGNGAIDMLKFILDETVKEEMTAHDDEKRSQHQFEDSMTALTSEEEQLRISLANDQELLATKEEELMTRKKELKAAKEEIAAIEAYLLKIKPGCDFIVSELANRKAARADETIALNKATTVIKATPAYTMAEEAAHQESLGECKEICNEVGEEMAKCKACLAKTSVPGYCAGHADTPGC